MSDSFAFTMIYRLILKIYKSTLIVLAFGFFIGFVLGILFIQAHKKVPTHLNKTIHKNSTRTAETVYHSWLHTKGYNRQCLSSDQVSYGNLTFDTESTFLKKEINVFCVIFVKKTKKVETILQTWGNHCNKIVFYGILDAYETNIPIYVIKPKSSWHYLCSAIHNIWLEHSANLQWILFAPDDIFALPENLRLVVSSLEPSVPHYLGHALMLWGESYNVAQAGYVLSRAALAAVAHRFNSTDACEKSGKHWKNEDYYLGNFLFFEDYIL